MKTAMVWGADGDITSQIILLLKPTQNALSAGLVATIILQAYEDRRQGKLDL